ncbi:MAG TPA: hypothetical protein VFE77_02730, partial [Rhodanobacter sp.]|nr:hypothetical protein [Rhodanobacter sp.]
RTIHGYQSTMRKTIKPCSTANIRRFTVIGHDLHQPQAHGDVIVLPMTGSLRQFTPTSSAQH